ncbi:MAG TPA: YhjD/YihY/BrkB family envelope integrity protein, partial [Spirochaetota bacterium]|nr:YhjD/YihY/BrkB family envelope integrity protein [Spirochaetota bacterium]
MNWKPLLHKLARAVARPFRAAGDFLIVDLRTVFKNFGEHDGELSTCALAFFLLISFIPISLVIIATMSFFYDSDSLVAFYVTQLKSQLPSIDIDRFIAVIDRIIFKKRYLAFIWVPFLFWWGSFVFDIIERGLEKAFRISENRRYWKSKLRHFLIILGMSFFIVIITMFSNFIVILKNAGIALIMERNLSEYGVLSYVITVIERIPLLLSSVMTLLVNAFLIFIIYRFVPPKKMSNRSLFKGALFASLSYEIIKSLFSYYITEINDYLKLLFARLSVAHCPQCGQTVSGDTPESIQKRLSDLSGDDRVLIAFPFDTDAQGLWVQQLVSEGFLRIFADGSTLDLDGLSGRESKRFSGKETLVVVDRL